MESQARATQPRVSTESKTETKVLPIAEDFAPLNVPLDKLVLAQTIAKTKFVLTIFVWPQNVPTIMPTDWKQM